MARGIEIPLIADVGQFLTGMKKAGDSVEQLADVFDDTSKAADGTADAVDTDMRAVASSSDAAASKVETSWKAALDTLSTRADKLDGKKIDMEVDLDTEGPLTKTQDLANEVRASLGETLGELSSTLAQGGASMEDVVDSVVEVSAEAAGALPGPWGLAGQALIATGSAVYGAWKKRMEDIAADASAMYQDMIESGADFLSEDFFQKKLQAFWDPMGESYESNMDKIDVLADLGVPMDEAARALVGYGDLSDDVYQKIADGLGGGKVGATAMAAAFDVLGVGSTDVLVGISRDLADSKESTRQAREAVDAYRDSIEEIPGKKKTDVDVDDDGSIRETQRRINDIHGGEATIRVNADTSSVYEGIAAAVAHAGRSTATIPVTARRVGGFYR